MITDVAYRDGVRAAYRHLRSIADGTPGHQADTADVACAFLEAKFKFLNDTE